MCERVFRIGIVVAACSGQVDFFAGPLCAVVLKRDNELYCKLIKCYCILWFFSLFSSTLRCFASGLSFSISFCLSVFLSSSSRISFCLTVSHFYRSNILYHSPCQPPRLTLPSLAPRPPPLLPYT